MVFFGPAGPVFHVTIDSLTFRKGDAADRWATKLQGLGDGAPWPYRWLYGFSECLIGFKEMVR